MPSPRHRHALVDARSAGLTASVLLLLVSACLSPAPSRGGEFDFFEGRIRPVLVEHCYECHDGSAGKTKGSFRIESRPGLLAGGESGVAAVVPGHPERSPLLRALRHDDPHLQMPPKRRLPDQVVADFEAWIRDGAPDPRNGGKGGGDGKPGNPSDAARNHWAFRPPQVAPEPSTRDVSWGRTPVDSFILAALEKAGLAPSPEADRRTLIRRLAFDLWGLPPTPEEVAAFESDRAPDAYERLVDRLLASPRYGERWGRHWLDVARYADTKGYVYYYEESRFVHPHAYRDWVIGAFNEDLPYDRFLLLQIAADHVLPDRSGAGPGDPDRASTLRWPPPTHDPDIAALGFLSLGRRFLDLEPDIIDDRLDTLMRGTQGLTIGCARCHDHKFDPIPTRDYYSLYGVFLGSEERLVELDLPGTNPGSATVRAGMEARVAELERKFRAAVGQVEDRLRDRAKDYLLAVVDPARLPSDANVRPQPEDINPFNVRQWERFLAARTNATDALFAPWHAFAALPTDSFPEQAAVVARRTLTNSAANLGPRMRALLEPAPKSMADVAGRYGDLFLAAHGAWRAAISNAPAGSPPPSRLADAELESFRQVLYGEGRPIAPPKGRIVDLDVHLYFDDPNRVALTKLQMELEQYIITNRTAGAFAVTLGDRPAPPASHVFRRGDPLQRREETPRRYLELLAGPERRNFTEGSGRLELARAIANPDNPLTARVLVNRVWAGHFGAGLVRTPSDFGVRCEPPTHPELLDWLARRFMADGWSIKRLHRLILCSAAYRQASPVAGTDAASAEAFRRDPDNRLLGRFPRRRLDLESFRDALFAVGGDLDDRMGGPAAPLETAPYNRRRTVYGLIDRRQLPGLVRIFDFANPDAHAPARHTTTIPQQALFLFNHPLIAERARRLADRLGSNDSADFEARLEQLYRFAFQRAPTRDERLAAREFLAEYPAIHGETGLRARELGPWEALAQVALLSNEFAFVD